MLVRLSPDARLLWKHWEDGVVLHHGAAGDTHLLEPAAVVVVQSLEDGPKSLAELEARLRGVQESPSPVVEHLRELLESFQELGIVEIVESPSGDDEAV